MGIDRILMTQYSSVPFVELRVIKIDNIFGCADEPGVERINHYGHGHFYTHAHVYVAAETRPISVLYFRI